MLGNEKADTRQMQESEMRIIRLCGKMLNGGISNGFLRDKTGVEDITESSGRDQNEMIDHLERMNYTNLIRRAREEAVSGLCIEED